MRDRMSKVMADKTTSAIKFHLANPLPKTLKPTMPTSEDKEKEIMLQIVLENYEEREHKLMIENDRMRKCLFGLYSTVQQSVYKISENVTIFNGSLQTPRLLFQKPSSSYPLTWFLKT
jgi:hypothetical protein